VADWREKPYEKCCSKGNGRNLICEIQRFTAKYS
jgi:hypothetical protein